MWSAVVLRRVALVAGTAAIMASGTLVACSSKEKPAESTPSSTGAANVSPTEKANVGSFRPTVKARPAPTALPGNVVTGN